jgi:glycerophosphoryl diester phosphodiesterase
MKIIINYKNLFAWGQFCLLMTLLFLNTLVIEAQTKPIIYQSNISLPSSNNIKIDDMIRSDYGSLYFIGTDLEQGIIGNINSNDGRIDVKVYDYDLNKSDGKGIEIYATWITASTPPSIYYENHLAQTPVSSLDPSGSYTLSDIEAAGNDIKKRAQDSKLYSPGACNNPTWTDVFLSAYLGRCTVGYTKPVQPVVVEVTVKGNAHFIKAKIPSIGIISIDKGIVIRNNPGDFSNYCKDNGSSNLCQLFDNIRNPKFPSSEDVIIAAHRGLWGNDLGTGAPENTQLAVQKAYYEGIKIVEMDLTSSIDNELIFMHDYVMKRLTNYPGTKFSFELPWSTMLNYKARKRNNELSTVSISKFYDVLREVQGKNMIMMVDVKELQSKGKDPNCLANCEFQSPEKQKESWTRIVRQSIRQAESIRAKKNLIFKTYLPPLEIYALIGKEMDNVLWTPMLVPNNFLNAQNQPDINLMTNFIDAWGNTNSEYKELIACFETNFFAPDDIMLQPFTKKGTRYQNLLHYIHATTGRRSGVFSEDPVNPKGSVNRWGKWKIKNPSTDIRGDFFQLLNIPYGNLMLITTDRSDVWKELKLKF